MPESVIDFYSIIKNKIKTNKYKTEIKRIKVINEEIIEVFNSKTSSAVFDPDGGLVKST